LGLGVEVALRRNAPLTGKEVNERRRKIATDPQAGTGLRDRFLIRQWKRLGFREMNESG
jgi:hypothetical protein